MKCIGLIMLVFLYLKAGAQNLEFVLSGGCNANVYKKGVKSIIGYSGNARAFLNIKSLQLGIGIETGSIKGKTEFLVANLQTGQGEIHEGKIYHANPFYSFNLYLNKVAK